SRQLGAHCRVSPIDLLGPLGVDGSGLDKRMTRLGLAQGLSSRVAAHGALPPAGFETAKGRQKRIAAHVGAEALDIAIAGKSHECLCKHPQAASRRGHLNRPRRAFHIFASNDNRSAWLLLDAHELVPLTIMPICVS